MLLLCWCNIETLQSHSSDFNEINLIMDTVHLHMITNQIINSEVNNDFVADSIINVDKE